MDRKPLPPPFTVGTRLRYVGQTRMWRGSDQIKAFGLVVEVVATRAGRRGTGRQIPGFDDGAIDRTHDGRSLYRAAGSEWAITAATANEWQELPPEIFFHPRATDKVRSAR